MGNDARWYDFSSWNLSFQWLLVVLVFGGFFVASWWLFRSDQRESQERDEEPLSAFLHLKAEWGFRGWVVAYVALVYFLGLIPPTVAVFVSEPNSSLWSAIIVSLIAVPAVGTVYLVMWKSGVHEVMASNTRDQKSVASDGLFKQVLAALSFGDWFILALFTFVLLIPGVEVASLVL